ncbi:MAG: FixH family protein, partial [Porticoccus sp.]|nr:FixH family protein [Porticoccus sp.]
MDTKPWYRQFWPWFLMALPGSVVIAGLTTVYIAFNGADTLVNDNY